jgi:hypothetical protein
MRVMLSKDFFTQKGKTDYLYIIFDEMDLLKELG